MAQILGLTVSHHPFTRFKARWMPSVLLGNLENGWKDKPHLKDPKNWPQAMQDEWDGDQGAAIGKQAQEGQIQAFQKLRAALDEFRPDFMLCIHRDQFGGRDATERPQYWLNAYEKADVKFYNSNDPRTDPYFGDDPDKVYAIAGHREGALYLADGLRKAGLNPKVFDAPTSNTGIGAHGQAGVFHLNWDQRDFPTPVVPFAVDPWRFGRRRNNEGLSTLDVSHPEPPLTPREGFELGRNIARIYKASPWRVALVASTAWGGANSTGVDLERIHPNLEEDRKLYEEWRNNRFDTWGDRFNWEYFEEQGEWELLSTIILAGAMTELGAKVQWSDFSSHYILNSSWVSTIFEVK